MMGHLSEALIDELAEAGEEVETDPGVAEHLAACALCREELALARLVTEGLDAIPRLEAPPELLTAVMASVSPKAQPNHRQSIALASMAALMTLIIAILWLVAGGAASLVVEALETVRSLEMITRIATSVWRAIPLELFALSTTVLVTSSAILSRLVSRFQKRSDAAVEAG